MCITLNSFGETLVFHGLYWSRNTNTMAMLLQNRVTRMQVYRSYAIIAPSSQHLRILASGESRTHESMLKALHTPPETTGEISRAVSPTIETTILRCLEAQPRPIGRSGLKDERKCKPLPVSYIGAYGESVEQIRIVQGNQISAVFRGAKLAWNWE